MKPHQTISNRLGAFAAAATLTVLALLAPQHALAALPASDNPCNGGVAIASGNNTGTGFAPWTSVTTPGDFYYSGSGMAGDACSGHAWGMFDSGGLNSCSRPFTNSGTLSVGQTVTVDLQNGGINGGGTQGMSLWNSSGNNVFEFYFNGGQAYWTVQDNAGALTNSAIPYAGSGCRVLFTLTSSTTYSLTVKTNASGTVTYGPFTGTLINATGGRAISQLRFFSSNIGGGNNMLIGQIGVICPDTLKITNSPTAQTNCAGTTASFSVSGIAGDSPTYQWYTNGTALANGSHYGGVINATLTITNVQAADAATTNQGYYCIVQDACGNLAISTTNALTVNALASSTITAPTSVCTNSTGNAASVANGGVGVTYGWTITGGTITAGATTNSILFSAGAATSLTLTCNVTNSSGCMSIGTSNVTINPLPPATIFAPAAVCPSSTGNTATVTTNVGATYSWSITNGTITSATTGTNISFNAGASGSNVGLNCTVTSAAGCSVNAAQVNVPITTQVGSAGSITGSSTVCQGSTGVSYTITNVNFATGYSWTAANATITAGQGTTNITVSFPNSGTVNVIVTATNACATGTPSTNTVTVNAAPSITGGPSAASVCSGSSASFTVTNTGANPTATWIKGYWNQAWSFNNTSNGLGNSTQNAGGNSGGINSGNGTALKLLNPANAITTNTAVRSFPSGALVVGQTFQVDMDNGFLNNSVQEGFELINVSNNVVWGFGFTGGSNDYFIAGITNLTTSTGFTGNGLRINFSLTSPTNYSVTVIAPLTAPVTNTYTGTVQFSVGGTNITGLRFYARANGANNGSQGTNGDLYFNNLIVGNYTDNAGNYTTWAGDASGTVVTNGGNISGATTTNLTINPAGATDAVNYEVILSNSCGSVTSSVAALTVNPLPTATIYAPAAVCPGTSGNIATVTTNVGATYSWSITNGTINSGQTGTNFSFTAGASGANVGLDCTVTSAAGCSVSAAHVDVPITSTVNAAGTITGLSTVCSNQTGVTYTITNVIGATGYSWVVPSGANITAGANTTNITVNFGTASGTVNVIVTPNGACSSGTPSTNTVIISPTSVGGTVTASASIICSGSSVTLTNGGYTGVNQWYVATNGGNFSSISGATSATYTPTLANSTSSNITYSYYSAVSSSPCSSANSTANTITVNPSSVGGTATAALTNLLSGLNTTITLSGYIGAIQWQSSPDNSTFTNIPGATASTYTTPALSATTYYQAVVTSGACSSSTSSVAQVTVSTAPSVTTGPTNIAVCSGSTAAFSATASGSATLNYQWQQVGTGWGNGWTFSGAGGHYIGSSTNNDKGAGAPCSSFGFNDINSSSGNSFGIYGGGSGGTNTEVALRAFPALTAGQAVSIDMDNGLVDSGQQNGFVLQNSSSNSVLKFYLLGGTNYQYADNSTGVFVPHDTGIPSTLLGLRVQFILTSTNTYTLVVKLCGDGTYEFNGTYSNTPIALLKMFNNNANGGSTNDLFFNNIVVGGYSDNADNYSGGNPGGWTNTVDHGNQPINNATNSSYTTAALNTTNSGTQYDVIVKNNYGAVVSTNATVTVNPLPGATIYAPAAVCPSTSGNIATITTNVGATYSWSITNGTIDSVTTGTNISFTAGATGANVGLDCTVTSASGCSSNAVHVDVAITSAPVSAAGPITGSSTVCQGTTGNYLITNVPGATGYSWVVPSGANITAGANTTNITVNFGTASGTVNVIVTPNGACSSGTPSTNTVIISPTSVGGTVTASASIICSGSSVTLTNGGYTGVNQWYVATNGGNFSSISGATSATYTPTLANSTSSNITYSYYSAVSSSPCSSANSTANTITVNPSSVGGTATAALTNLLSGLNTTITLSGYIGAIQWQSSPDNSTFTNIPGATASTYTTPALSATTYYQAVVTSGACSSSTSSVAQVTVGMSAAVTSGPNNQTNCSGSTATFTATYAGTPPLYYAWSKHSNAGWGSAWTRVGGSGGGEFLGSSTDNENSAPACNSFTSLYDINSPSGNALGMFGGTGGENVTRSFPAISTYPTVIGVDMDNGGVDAGVKNGFSLQTSGGADVLQFYFLGGANDYYYNDGTQNDSGIGYLVQGLRVKFILTSTNTYTLLVQPCGGSTYEFTGTYSGTIAQLKLMNNNVSTGIANNLYFNNFIVGGYVDNADNYTGSFAGVDEGDAPISGATNASYTTPALNYPGDNGNQYQVVAYNAYGDYLSGAATAVVNPLPSTSAITGTNSVQAGSTATYSVTNTAGSTYAWTYPGDASSTGSTSNSITITFGSTSGDVSVIETNSSGCVGTQQSLFVTVITCTAPGIVGGIDGVTNLCVGSELVLTLTNATGTAPLSYQWQTNNVTIASATNSAYTNLSVVVSDTGNYVCVVSNACGSITSAVATVTVNSSTANNVTYNETKGYSFKIAVTNLLSNASGSGGVALAAVQSPTANGVTNIISGGEIYYLANVTNIDTFTYTVASVTGGCTATGTVTINPVYPPGTQARIGIPTNGVVNIKFFGIPGTNYVVQTATNVIFNPYWPLSTNTAGSDGSWLFTDPNATNAQQYYRSSWQP